MSPHPDRPVLVRMRGPLTGIALALALALLLPGPASAKRKADYSDKTYGGKTIEEYCSALLGVETFDLTEADLEQCDKRYSEQVDALDDLTIGDIAIGRSTATAAPEAEEEVAPEEKLSRKEQEELARQKEAEEKARLDKLGLVEFEETPAANGGQGEEEEDPLLGEGDTDEPWLDEEPEVFDDAGDTVIDDDFGGGHDDSGLEDLDDADGDRGKKDKKKKEKKDKKKKGSDERFEDADDLPFD